MSISGLLASLEAVRETGHGKYIASCPAHDDRSPSLAIKECSDGRVLLHCFAGCETEDVLAGIGLTFADVMPEHIGNKHRFKPQRFDARQALVTLDHESLSVAIIGADFLQHREIDEPTWNCLAESVGRISSARAAIAPLRCRK